MTRPMPDTQTDPVGFWMPAPAPADAPRRRHGAAPRPVQPFWTRWWFWLILAVVALAVIGSTQAPAAVPGSPGACITTTTN